MKIRRDKRCKISNLIWFIAIVVGLCIVIYIQLRSIIMNNNDGDNDASSSLPSFFERTNAKSKNMATGRHHCLNSDFKPEHSVSVWTMLNDNMDYTRGALKMGRGVKRYTTTPHDLVVMEIESKPLGKENWDQLSKVGYKRCVVASIPAPKQTRFDLKEKFGVLHVWAATVYDTILFIDADTLVKNNLDDLINMDLQGKSIGVTKDIRGGKWVDTFNSGVLLLHPNEKEFERLLKLLRSGIVYEYIMSDQGFLNQVYQNDWHEIGFVNNANLALYKFQRKFWDDHKIEDINIIHFTMQKPWKCRPNGPYAALCKIWNEAE